MRDATKITVEEYKSAFLALERDQRVSDSQRAMLRAHYRVRKMTAHKMAKAVNYKSFHGVNLVYGTLAKLVAEEVGYQPPKDWTFLSTLVDFGEAPRSPYPMTLRDNVAKALEELGWV